MRHLPKVLVVEDEPAIAELIAVNLRHNGFVPVWAEDGPSAQRELDAVLPDVILLDWMLPSQSGLQLARKWRGDARTRGIPILMLTARGDEPDKVAGLDAGADDYITKPFSTQELLARIRAVLRRRTEGGAPQAQALRFGVLEIDRDARTVTVAGQPCELTSYQFDLLVAMAERAGRVLTRDQIMEAVRGRELEAFDRSIDVHMGRIRAAIEDDAKNPRRILTVRGVGYVFAKQQD